MKTISTRFFLILSVINLLLADGGHSQAIKALDKDFTTIENYLRVPAGVILGQVVGLAVDQKNNLYVLHRAGRLWDLTVRVPLADPVILKFSEKGELIDSMGSGMFILPHMLSVDAKGNIWVVDASMHQVFKFSSDGKLLLKLGEAFKVGDDPLHFNLPTDVAVMKDGSFYVADGYGNSRIAKFTSDGKYLFSWGQQGESDGQFKIPHSIAMNENKIFVADRENSRLQVFDLKGNFLSALSVGNRIGRLFSLTFDWKGNLYLSGIKKEGSGTLIFSPGMKEIGELPSGGHDIAVDSNGTIYVASGNNVVKFVPGKK